MIRLDDTEKKMILLLQRDGRRTFVDLAETIGVSERTISRKYRRLINDKVMRIVAFVNPFRLGYPLPAMIGLSVENAQLRPMLSSLTNMPSLRFVTMAAGSYDILVEGYYKNAAHLLRFVTDDLAFDGIRGSTTFIVLNIYKFSYEWGLGVPRDELTALYEELGIPGDERNDDWGHLAGSEPPVLSTEALEGYAAKHDEVLDPLERRIVELLQQNGRSPYGEIAQHTDVTEETVRRKVQKLLDEGTLKIAAQARPQAVGFNTPVFLGMQVDRTLIPQIAQQMGRLRQVAYLAAATGPADLLAACYLRDNAELASFLTNELGKIRGVYGVDASLMLGVRKHQYRM